MLICVILKFEMVDVDPSFTPGSTDAVKALYDTALDSSPNCVPHCPEAVVLLNDALIRISEVPTFQRVAAKCSNDDRSREAADNALQRAKDAVIESRLKGSDCPGPRVWQFFGRYTLTLCADTSKPLSQRLSVNR